MGCDVMIQCHWRYKNAVMDNDRGQILGRSVAGHGRIQRSEEETISKGHSQEKKEKKIKVSTLLTHTLPHPPGFVNV